MPRVLPELFTSDSRTAFECVRLAALRPHTISGDANPVNAIAAHYLARFRAQEICPAHFLHVQHVLQNELAVAIHARIYHGPSHLP